MAGRRPINPGEHHVVFEAPGLPPVSATWVILQAEKNRRERVVFPASDAASMPAVVPVASPMPASAPLLASHPVERAPGAPVRATPFWQSTWFWGAVGAAALIGGAIYFFVQP